MIVSSRNVEFGYELLTALPYAYEMHIKGVLQKTISGKMSEPLYFFSPEHEIDPSPRSYFNTYKAGITDRKKKYAGVPYMNIHTPDPPRKCFPPLYDYYQNDEHKWSKPTLCICNRANIEWGKDVINYFNADILDWLFTKLKGKYKIIYVPVAIPEEIQDHEKPVDVGDIAVAKKHRVRLFTDIAKGKNWNEELMKVFANCEHYITMNGGYSILASYFAGTNIIYSKPGETQAKELETYEFWRWYPNINNVRTLHVPSYDDLKERVQALYLDRLPVANVVIRTSGRPNYFRDCIKSVLRQDYKNINIVVMCDDPRSLPYTHKYPIRVIVPKRVKLRDKPKGDDYGVFFPANDYIRQALNCIEGYVFIMDDDDMYIDDSAISKVMAQAKPDSLMAWRVRFPDRLVPGDSFGKKITLYDVDSNGICWHTGMETDWSPWKRADYRTASKFERVIWIDEVLTAIQERANGGNRQDKKETISTDYMKKHVQPYDIEFTSDFKEYKKGEVCTLPWIKAMQIIHRRKGVVCQKKELNLEYEDKMLHPQLTTKDEGK